ncbi:MAG: DUF3015 domain-containing protein [Hahellaceae bacterium]|nr:DUF3015 domain-containing protein [Hahellaceae bacterium]
MKRILAIASLTLASSFAAADIGPGCGVGAVIFKGSSGLVPHVLAATTNGIYGNQTFAMSTGTLGCQPNSPITLASMYMDENLDKVARDVSRGEGEYLNTLAVMFGVKDEDRAHFYTTLQQNFSRLFPSDATQSGDAFEELLAVMKADQSLAAYAG